MFSYNLKTITRNHFKINTGLILIGNLEVILYGLFPCSLCFFIFYTVHFQDLCLISTNTQDLGSDTRCDNISDVIDRYIDWYACLLSGLLSCFQVPFYSKVHFQDRCLTWMNARIKKVAHEHQLDNSLPFMSLKDPLYWLHYYSTL